MRKVKICILETIVKETWAEVSIDADESVDLDNYLGKVEKNSKATEDMKGYFSRFNTISESENSINICIDEMEELEVK